MARPRPSPAFEIPLEEKDLADIGYFIVVWNQIEMLMELVVTTTLEIGLPAGEKIMNSPNVRPRAEILAKVVAARVDDDEIRNLACQCSNRILKLSNFRNCVAHGRWYFNTDSHAPASTKQFISSKPINLSAITSKLSEVCKISNALADLHYRIIARRSPENFALPSPWHGKC